MCKYIYAVLYTTCRMPHLHKMFYYLAYKSIEIYMQTFRLFSSPYMFHPLSFIRRWQSWNISLSQLRIAESFSVDWSGEEPRLKLETTFIHFHSIGMVKVLAYQSKPLYKYDTHCEQCPFLTQRDGEMRFNARPWSWTFLTEPWFLLRGWQRQEKRIIMRQTELTPLSSDMNRKFNWPENHNIDRTVSKVCGAYLFGYCQCICVWTPLKDELTNSIWPRM